ncbi:MAG: exodeoxyribonuclease III [Candidatus Heimdallarchaeota archaeon]|nr:exodeoxyribonuclease III [Candidatus Heimdallarchaeota archaeon]
MFEYTLYSWNVAGFRALLKKDLGATGGIIEWMAKVKGSIYAYQEVKVEEIQLKSEIRRPQDYRSYWHSAEKKGYSGVATYVHNDFKVHKRSTSLALDPDDFMDTSTAHFDREGRFIRTDFDEFILLNVYFPNGGRGLTRLGYKMAFYDRFLDYCSELKADNQKVIVCGDVNTAHHDIDLKNFMQNRKRTGFLPEERAWVTKFIESGFIDSFRLMHGDIPDKYTYWDNISRARERNVGWRIDYFLVDEALRDNITQADIHSDVMGSDHCPISLTLKF